MRFPSARYGLSDSELLRFAAVTSQSTPYLVSEEVLATKHGVGAGLIANFAEWALKNATSPRGL